MRPGEIEMRTSLASSTSPCLRHPLKSAWQVMALGAMRSASIVRNTDTARATCQSKEWVSQAKTKGGVLFEHRTVRLQGACDLSREQGR